jgi:hypothetical protein
MFYICALNYSSNWTSKHHLCGQFPAEFNCQQSIRSFVGTSRWNFIYYGMHIQPIEMSDVNQCVMSTYVLFAIWCWMEMCDREKGVTTARRREEEKSDE